MKKLLVVAMLATSSAVWAGNYEQDNYDGSFGDVGTGEVSAAHRDPASGSCSICRTIVDLASRATGGSNGFNGGAVGGTTGSIGGFGCCH